MVDLVHGDCITVMQTMADNSVDFTLTDIPYDVVNGYRHGLRNLNKGDADILTFAIGDFLKLVYRVTKNSICIFCGKEQFSDIYKFFASKKGTVRAIVWQKSNPSPLNGEHIYLSGMELAVWFKKSGAKVFNAFCKNTVFIHPNGRSNIFPTEKNHKLLKELILDNTNVGDIVFDPCAGSGSHLLVARQNGRNAYGIEINSKYFEIADKRLKGTNYAENGD